MPTRRSGGAKKVLSASAVSSGKWPALRARPWTSSAQTRQSSSGPPTSPYQSSSAPGVPQRASSGQAMRLPAVKSARSCPPVDAGGGPVLFADGVDVSWVAQYRPSLASPLGALTCAACNRLPRIPSGPRHPSARSVRRPTLANKCGWHPRPSAKEPDCRPVRL